MPGNKRKDMPEHIRALLTPQLSVPFKPAGRAMFDPGMRFAPLKATLASCGIAPVPGTNLRPQNGCN